MTPSPETSPFARRLKPEHVGISVADLEASVVCGTGKCWASLWTRWSTCPTT